MIPTSGDSGAAATTVDGSTMGGKSLTGGTDDGPSGTAGATATGSGFSGILVPGLRATANGTPFGAVGSGAVGHVGSRV